MAMVIVIVAALTGLIFNSVSRIADSMTPAVSRDLRWKALRGAVELSKTSEIGLLVRDAAVRFLMPDGGDDADLRIGPAGDANAGLLAQFGIAPLGSHDHRCTDFTPVHKMQHSRVGGLAHVGDSRRRHQAQRPLQLLHARESRGAQMPVLGHHPQEFAADLLVIVVEEQGRISVRNPDFADRFKTGKVRPEADG